MEGREGAREGLPLSTRERKRVGEQSRFSNRGRGWAGFAIRLRLSPTCLQLGHEATTFVVRSLPCQLPRAESTILVDCFDRSTGARRFGAKPTHFPHPR